MRLKSYAKINLTLDILHKREDGYHELDTLFQQLELHDVITLQPIESGIEFSCSDPCLDNTDNLAYRAAVLMKDHFRIAKGVDIALDKIIPVGAGLSGGSSNAAAILTGLNTLWGIDAPLQELMRLGAKLGSDVNAHLLGGSCRGRGRGELLEKVSMPVAHAVVVFPGFSVSTKDAYAQLDLSTCGKSTATVQSMRLPELHNDFEDSVFASYPQLSALKARLGPLALLSGSGSCVFGLFDDEQEARQTYDALKQDYKTVFLTRTRS